MQGPWVFGGLINQVWSVTGDENRPSVSQTLIQPFLNYNFKGGWYLSSSPIITANWMAHGNDRWIVPLGGGGGKVFMVGKQPVNAQFQGFYHVARPDFVPEWTLRFQIALLFPYKIMKGQDFFRLDEES